MRRSLIGAVVALAAALMLAPAASAVDEVNTKKLRKGVTAAGILDHMRALQRIANANDGTRAATTSGYDASLDYVEKRMKKAGYKVTRDEFPFAAGSRPPPRCSSARARRPTPRGRRRAAATTPSRSSRARERHGPTRVTTNDIVLDPTGEPGSGTSGCEEADWGGQDLTGKIALVERGTCAVRRQDRPRQAARRCGGADLQRRLSRTGSSRSRSVRRRSSASRSR